MPSHRLTRRGFLLLAAAGGLAGPLAGCGGGGAMAEVTPEAQKKTQDMLNQMHDQMKLKYQAAGKAPRKGR